VALWAVAIGTLLGIVLYFAYARDVPPLRVGN
jgi:hypothetical protein